MLLQSSLLLVVVVAMQSCNAWIVVNKNLTNRVIHIEALRYRGYWVDCYNIPMNSFYGAKESDVYYQPRTQFKVGLFFIGSKKISPIGIFWSGKFGLSLSFYLVP